MTAKGRKVFKLCLNPDCPRHGKLYRDFSSYEYETKKVERGLCPACKGTGGEDELQIVGVE